MAKNREKKPLSKQQKLAIGLGIALLVLFIITLGIQFGISEKSPYYYDYVLSVMPKSIDTEFDGKEMTLYVEKNKEFEKTKDQPIDAFKVYYYKDNDKSTDKIYLKNGTTLEGQTESTNLMILSFLADAKITDGIVRNILKYAIIVLCILLAVYLIFVWYVSWSIRYDKKKEMNKENN